MGELGGGSIDQTKNAKLKTRASHRRRLAILPTLRQSIALATLLACVFGSAHVIVADTVATQPTAIELAERAEYARIAVVEKVAPSVVCIFDEDERGGGSGVIISPDGYGLTNFHVVEAMVETRSGFGGMSDGKLYPLQVLGIDPGGDVAMFKLTGRDPFPFSNLGDSDLVRVGDTAIAMGNPFLLSDDYTPTVTSGIVSGIHRYQYGSGDVLLYSDCIQVDTAINPGNSGGPLFNLAGEVIGINGRISVSMRGRVNVGMGYAITSNQIKPFIPGLRAGLLVEHGTIQATVRDRDAGVVFIELYEDGPAWNIGIRPGDVLLRFANQPIESANHFASVLGTLPGDWPVALSYRDASGEVHHKITRTEGVKIKTRKPYEPDGDVVARAVERVLRRFHDTLGKSINIANDMRWKESHAAGESANDPNEYAVAASDDSRLVWEPVDDNSGSVVVDRIDGELKATHNDAPLPLPMDLVFRARAFVQQRLVESDPQTSAGLFEHCGADALLDLDSNGQSHSTLLECLSASLDDHTTIRLGFDAAAGNLRRITVTDEPTREVAGITLADETGWPVDLDVESTLGRTAIRIVDRNMQDVDHHDDAPANTAKKVPTPAAKIFEDVANRVVKLTGARVGQSEGYGCGILISTNGLALTVDSGLLNSPNVRAHLYDGTPRQVELVHADRDLEAGAIQLKPVEFSDTPEETHGKYPCFDLNQTPSLTIGQPVFAGGNPFKVADKGEHISLSRGVYCGTTKLDATRGTQDFPYRGDVLVIDAITSAPGFAGGALVDGHGELLGLVGRGVESRFTYTQLNYAIPISVLSEFVANASNPATHESGTSTAKGRDVYHGIKFFELGYRSNPVYVERVRRGSPASRAGIRKDDLIIGANGRPIAKLEVLERIIDESEPGDVLELTVLRDDKVKKIRIELEEAK
ncbi:MAG: trypsin-like peptidase domain-containing protein [Phycisphaerae bacterium]